MAVSYPKAIEISCFGPLRQHHPRIATALSQETP
jgi:hypothetical protein